MYQSERDSMGKHILDYGKENRSEMNRLVVIGVSVVIGCVLVASLIGFGFFLGASDQFRSDSKALLLPNKERETTDSATHLKALHPNSLLVNKRGQEAVFRPALNTTKSGGMYTTL